MTSATRIPEWDRLSQSAREQWTVLSEQDLMRLDGDRETLAQVLHEKYGLAADEVERQIDSWIRQVSSGPP